MSDYTDKPTITMYTCQTKTVLDAINRDGISYVKQIYIDQKYQETAWIFKEAYSFFVNYASGLLEKPKQAQSPVWLFHAPEWAKPEQGSMRLKVEVPKEEVLFFDMRKWNSILNLNLIGTKDEEKEFEKELEKWGLMHSSDIFLNSFYPMLKSKVKNSWKKLFEDSQDIIRELEENSYQKFGNKDTDYIQGAVWCLKKEWIREKYLKKI